jgi:hypothetical protein
VDELTQADASGQPLIKVTLVPVEVFGADEEECPRCSAIIRLGYGLMDAVSAWSDCNRAIGRIYRVEDEGFERNADGAKDCITVYVSQSEMAKFAKVHGEGGDDRCPACHVRYAELPEQHAIMRPACTGSTKGATHG